ncbi:MAG: AAA family ATPase, partial [Chloroflexota bacterium]
DEINRANLSRVFGELMYLLEYRDRTINLASGDSFQIPENVRIIGTMNTADRSIALVDHALRRRFAFLELSPNMVVLRNYHSTHSVNVEGLIQKLEEINQAINNPHFSLGISFFLHPNLSQNLMDIWKMEIEPYLTEYFFDQPGEVQKFCWDRIKDQLIPK